MHECTYGFGLSRQHFDSIGIAAIHVACIVDDRVAGGDDRIGLLPCLAGLTVGHTDGIVVEILLSIILVGKVEPQVCTTFGEEEEVFLGIQFMIQGGIAVGLQSRPCGEILNGRGACRRIVFIQVA